MLEGGGVGGHSGPAPDPLRSHSLVPLQTRSSPTLDWLRSTPDPLLTCSGPTLDHFGSAPDPLQTHSSPTPDRLRSRSGPTPDPV